MPRVFSGIKPTGEVHLGNLLGALRNWVTDQDTHDCVYCVVDLHALTVPQDPAELRATSLSAGPDADLGRASTRTRCTLFVQSHVHEHAELAWLMECTAAYGELRRMTQFKDKSEQGRVRVRRAVHLSGPDGGRHPPLRHRPGAGGRRPAPAPRAHPRRRRAASTPATARRSWSPRPTSRRRAPGSWTCRSPTDKMSKSEDSPAGHDRSCSTTRRSIEKKIKRAVTDTDAEVTLRPGDQARACRTCSRSSAAATGRDPEARGRGLHAVRPPQGRHRGGRDRAARPDPGPLPRAGGRPRRDRTPSWPRAPTRRGRPRPLSWLGRGRPSASYLPPEPQLASSAPAGPGRRSTGTVQSSSGRWCSRGPGEDELVAAGHSQQVDPELGIEHVLADATGEAPGLDPVASRVLPGSGFGQRGDHPAEGAQVRDRSCRTSWSRAAARTGVVARCPSSASTLRATPPSGAGRPGPGASTAPVRPRSAAPGPRRRRRRSRRSAAASRRSAAPGAALVSQHLDQACSMQKRLAGMASSRASGMGFWQRSQSP